jgi:chromosome partitioning protein
MEKLLDWLKDHDLLSINRLEERVGIPQRSLHKAIKGIRPLPEKYEQPLTKELKKYGYK